MNFIKVQTTSDSQIKTDKEFFKMFTNRDEVLEKALQIFAKMNYEKASQMD